MNMDQIKKWIRTGSYAFAKNSIQGKNLSDNILRSERAFFKNKKLEYWVPKEVNPSVILDIGGNIGVSSIYFSDYFPFENEIPWKRN